MSPFVAVGGGVDLAISILSMGITHLSKKVTYSIWLFEIYQNGSLPRMILKSMNFGHISLRRNVAPKKTLVGLGLSLIFQRAVLGGLKDKYL